MRPIAALLVLPLMLLTGCGSDGGSKGPSSPPASASAPASPPPVPTPVASASPMPSVSGAPGRRASITLPSGPPTGRFVVATATQGTGPVVGKGDWVTIQYTATDWTTRKAIPSSYDRGQKPQLYQAGSGQLIPAFDTGVVGRRVGSRVLVVAPPAAAFGGKGSTALGVGPDDTLVFAVDILSAVPQDTVLRGRAVPAPSGMPQVKDNGKAAATITVPAGQKPPTALQKAVLIKGDGPKVASGQTIVAQYTGALWATGKNFDSSWDHGGATAFQIGTGNVIKGWDQGLVGQTVGSRVLLVIPPSLGYGAKAQGPIPADSTLVFVIDILQAV
ncbi:FKBP-type peptidyl-prolyl cis-trans isomerase [Streptacidiphilus sp. ASG 303]|uniref:FKBP-type peptidyl-prolyl cis-trans isomerase n=1 Tax=Streptacidiphilus sp. ASG 303 TaxID=2896847 RepID=UPI001E4359FE|nr:FKBP-type peptidyl-prolyl cis-trans isomerase [Streptacidiphilus sp. ASG 303]MCD0481325.1 FKBP-type peptidyl-prolyl cis-trans isomerase [Streptacidiphilus sp. ASG 303]